ncbi:MAG: 3-oxoacyl-ACP reductase [Jiangellaceae bacterium]
MTDRYQSFTQTGAGRFVVKRLRLPDPPVLRRYEPDQPVLAGSALVGGTGHLRPVIDDVLAAVEATVHAEPLESMRYAALVYDASGLSTAAELRALYEFFHPVVRSVAPSGRVIVLGLPPEQADDTNVAITQRALEGFTRSLGKEIRRGSTVQLVYVGRGAEQLIGSTLRFLLSAKSAYVSGQVIRIVAADPAAGPDDWQRPLAGRVAVVTGAAQGIGAATAEVLARDGAHVVCLDLPAEGEALAKLAGRIRGSSLGMDITEPEAGTRLATYLSERHERVDVVVHNAGVTRDKTLGKMSPSQWDQALAVNLIAPQRLTSALVDAGTLGPGGRLIGFSSVAGVAGNAGQTNYATSKAGVIGLVHALAPVLADHAITINAVAPGFIDTRMTAAMPLVIREAGRRMNSMGQAGLPVDVAETVAWLAQPGSAGVTGNVVRVCGQSLVGA